MHQHRRRRQLRSRTCPALNIAATHHDARAGGGRLVYGGHTIRAGAVQATRLLPNLVTVLGWQSLRSTSAVHEGDTLHSELRVESADPLPGGRGGVLTLRSQVYADGENAGNPVLDWRFTYCTSSRRITDG